MSSIESSFPGCFNILGNAETDSPYLESRGVESIFHIVGLKERDRSASRQAGKQLGWSEGDRVELVTRRRRRRYRGGVVVQKSPRASADWLRMVASQKASN